MPGGQRCRGPGKRRRRSMQPARACIDHATTVLPPLHVPINKRVNVDACGSLRSASLESCEAARLRCAGQVRRRLLLPHGACEFLANRSFANHQPSSQHGDDLTSRRISPPTREIANCTRDTRTDTPYTKHLHNGPQGSLLERSR
jgi:hypothetical protein